MECSKALPVMHDFLDGDLSTDLALELKKHLIACSACHHRFRELEQAGALLQHGLPQVPVPQGLTAKIMQGLPPESRKNGFALWIRRHPAASVAAIFVMVMFASYVSLWNEDTELMVKGSALSQVVIQDDKVIVPAGHTVEGDLLVENGVVEVEGEVRGNVVVIDGSVALASTAKVAGDVMMVDQALEWVWFKMNQWFVYFSK